MLNVLKTISKNITTYERYFYQMIFIENFENSLTVKYCEKNVMYEILNLMKQQEQEKYLSEISKIKIVLFINSLKLKKLSVKKKTVA